MHWRTWIVVSSTRIHCSLIRVNLTNSALKLQLVPQVRQNFTIPWISLVWWGMNGVIYSRKFKMYTEKNGLAQKQWKNKQIDPHSNTLECVIKIKKWKGTKNFTIWHSQVFCSLFIPDSVSILWTTLGKLVRIYTLNKTASHYRTTNKKHANSILCLLSNFRLS